MSRRQRALSSEDIAKISGSYHAFRSLNPTPQYEDAEGFCKKATRKEIEARDFVLAPNRYVGTPEGDKDELSGLERLATYKTRLVEEMNARSATEAQLRTLLDRIVPEMDAADE